MIQRLSLLSLFFLFFLAAPIRAQVQGQCVMCGMDLSKYTHVRYQVKDKQGKAYTTCGVQCGLLLQLNLKDTFASATATDLFSHRTIDADKAWYVYHSSIITDMGPGFIAFGDKTIAEKFIRGFGGELLDFQSALDKVRRGFK